MSLINRFSLTDSVAIITGAGKGIGRAIALAYAEAGAKVVCAARTLSDVEAVANQIKANGGDALAVACDVTCAQSRAALVQQTLDTFSKVTHLVNNAGGGGPNDPLQMPWQELDRLLHFNVTSVYHLIQLCIPHMRAAGGGNIINITSVAARYVQPNFSSYGTAKAALVHMTKLLSQDFAPEVRINAISPGPILTDALNKVMPDKVKDIMTKNTPLKRLGEVEDIAAAALYLASPASGWVSGKILDIDGGADVSVFPS
ncbi:MAG: glucose 1-dehydrogenase [Pseudomonas sp.]|jgi:7-alpha-hydroxysteroid dehydrogenase|nr:glucose 1-dehydrogenase [Pseudomonas sp.]MDD2222029.1 glucose 1-dehydrogenase [Pseudomonas sp.]MDY0414854.1 glucose 1-dehydrogenase [Pseudomonas sp.]